MRTLYGDATEQEERVARAICQAYSLSGGASTYEAEFQSECAWDLWLTEAKAAIAATN